MSWRLCVATAVAGPDGTHRIRCACQRCLRYVGGMGIAYSLVFDGAKPEALVGIVCCLLEPPVIENEQLGLRMCQIELAVVCAFKAAGQVHVCRSPVEAGAVEKRACS